MAKIYHYITNYGQTGHNMYNTSPYKLMTPVKQTQRFFFHKQGFNKR